MPPETTTRPDHTPDRPAVTLVIPGHNCADTLGPCLSAACTVLDDPQSDLAEIIYVDDHSSDSSPDIAAEFPVRILASERRGAGAARNAGIRAANTPLVWFVDSDCVTEPDALRRLTRRMHNPRVAGISGSYGIMNRSSLLAALIHEEIIQRHIRMASTESVNFLATFNVLYRRDVVLELGGFDERYLKGQDAELSFRVAEAGHTLAFEIDSRVRHFHEERLSAYLRTQAAQGRWRVALHLEHPGHARGDSYSSIIDHAQPPIAVLALAATPLAVIPLVTPATNALAWLPAALWTLLIALHVPMTAAIVARTRDPRMLAFVPMGAVRAIARGVGALNGLIDRVTAARTRAAGSPPTPNR